MQTYASRSTADDSYFRYALSFYRDGQYDSAGIWFSMFTKEYPGSSMLTAAQYWHAKSLLALGDSAAAADRFREVADSYPIEYYGFNARGICASLCKNPPSFAIDTVNDPAAAVEWLDSVSKLVEKALGPGDSLSLTVGLSCAALGMHEHADFFLEPLEICYERNLSLQYLLAQVYKESGDLARSFGIVRRFAWTVPRQDRLSMPLALYTLLYPFGFDSLVGRFCDEFKVEPELIYAIMRQESIFDPVIVSPVGAIGLMQIMPFTGEQIARELNDTYDTDSLYNPAVNVRYGVYYIGSLIKEFEGDMVCAVAGFNGGPHNVKKWLETKKSDDQDLFVEDIGFSETRNYVKKVLANYWLYKKLAQVRKPVQD
jgi:soluble lytic murein transglycosylase